MSTHRGDGHVLDIILSDDLEQRRRLVRPNDPRPTPASSSTGKLRGLDGSHRNQAAPKQYTPVYKRESPTEKKQYELFRFLEEASQATAPSENGEMHSKSVTLIRAEPKYLAKYRQREHEQQEIARIAQTLTKEVTTTHQSLLFPKKHLGSSSSNQTAQPTIVAELRNRLLGRTVKPHSPRALASGNGPFSSCDTLQGHSVPVSSKPYSHSQASSGPVQTSPIKSPHGAPFDPPSYAAVPAAMEGQQPENSQGLSPEQALIRRTVERLLSAMRQRLSEVDSALVLLETFAPLASQQTRVPKQNVNTAVSSEDSTPRSSVYSAAGGDQWALISLPKRRSKTPFEISLDSRRRHHIMEYNAYLARKYGYSAPELHEDDYDASDKLKVSYGFKNPPDLSSKSAHDTDSIAHCTHSPLITRAVIVEALEQVREKLLIRISTLANELTELPARFESRPTSPHVPPDTLALSASYSDRLPFESPFERVSSPDSGQPQQSLFAPYSTRTPRLSASSTAEPLLQPREQAKHMLMHLLSSQQAFEEDLAQNLPSRAQLLSMIPSWHQYLPSNESAELDLQLTVTDGGLYEAFTQPADDYLSGDVGLARTGEQTTSLQAVQTINVQFNMSHLPRWWYPLHRRSQVFYPHQTQSMEPTVRISVAVFVRNGALSVPQSALKELFVETVASSDSQAAGGAPQGQLHHVASASHLPVRAGTPLDKPYVEGQVEPQQQQQQQQQRQRDAAIWGKVRDAASRLESVLGEQRWIFVGSTPVVPICSALAMSGGDLSRSRGFPAEINVFGSHVVVSFPHAKPLKNEGPQDNQLGPTRVKSKLQFSFEYHEGEAQEVMLVAWTEVPDASERNEQLLSQLISLHTRIPSLAPREQHRCKLICEDLRKKIIAPVVTASSLPRPIAVAHFSLSELSLKPGAEGLPPRTIVYPLTASREAQPIHDLPKLFTHDSGSHNQDDSQQSHDLYPILAGGDPLVSLLEDEWMLKQVFGLSETPLESMTSKSRDPFVPPNVINGSLFADLIYTATWLATYSLWMTPIFPIPIFGLGSDDQTQSESIAAYANGMALTHTVPRFLEHFVHDSQSHQRTGLSVSHILVDSMQVHSTNHTGLIDSPSLVTGLAAMIPAPPARLIVHAPKPPFPPLPYRPTVAIHTRTERLRFTPLSSADTVRDNIRLATSVLASLESKLFGALAAAQMLEHGFDPKEGATLDEKPRLRFYRPANEIPANKVFARLRALAELAGGITTGRYANSRSTGLSALKGTTTTHSIPLGHDGTEDNEETDVTDPRANDTHSGSNLTYGSIFDSQRRANSDNDYEFASLRNPLRTILGPVAKEVEKEIRDTLASLPQDIAAEISTTPKSALAQASLAMPPISNILSAGQGAMTSSEGTAFSNRGNAHGAGRGLSNSEESTRPRPSLQNLAAIEAAAVAAASAARKARGRRGVAGSVASGPLRGFVIRPLISSSESHQIPENSETAQPADELFLRLLQTGPIYALPSSSARDSSDSQEPQRASIRSLSPVSPLSPLLSYNLNVMSNRKMLAECFWLANLFKCAQRVVEAKCTDTSVKLSPAKLLKFFHNFVMSQKQQTRQQLALQIANSLGILPQHERDDRIIQGESLANTIAYTPRAGPHRKEGLSFSPFSLDSENYNENSNTILLNLSSTGLGTNSAAAIADVLVATASAAHAIQQCQVRLRTHRELVAETQAQHARVVALKQAHKNYQEEKAAATARVQMLQQMHEFDSARNSPGLQSEFLSGASPRQLSRISSQESLPSSVPGQIESLPEPFDSLPSSRGLRRQALDQGSEFGQLTALPSDFEDMRSRGSPSSSNRALSPDATSSPMPSRIPSNVEPPDPLFELGRVLSLAIDLSNNSLSDIGVTYLAEALRVADYVEELDLNTNPITSEGFVAIFEALGGTHYAAAERLDILLNKVEEDERQSAREREMQENKDKLFRNLNFWNPSASPGHSWDNDILKLSQGTITLADWMRKSTNSPRPQSPQYVLETTQPTTPDAVFSQATSPVQHSNPAKPSSPSQSRASTASSLLPPPPPPIPEFEILMDLTTPAGRVAAACTLGLCSLIPNTYLPPSWMLSTPALDVFFPREPPRQQSRRLSNTNILKSFCSDAFKNPASAEVQCSWSILKPLLASNFMWAFLRSTEDMSAGAGPNHHHNSTGAQATGNAMSSTHTSGQRSLNALPVAPTDCSTLSANQVQRMQRLFFARFVQAWRKAVASTRENTIDKLKSKLQRRIAMFNKRVATEKRIAEIIALEQQAQLLQQQQLQLGTVLGKSLQKTEAPTTSNDSGSATQPKSATVQIEDLLKEFGNMPKPSLACIHLENQLLSLYNEGSTKLDGDDPEIFAKLHPSNARDLQLTKRHLAKSKSLTTPFSGPEQPNLSSNTAEENYRAVIRNSLQNTYAEGLIAYASELNYWSDKSKISSHALPTTFQSFSGIILENDVAQLLNQLQSVGCVTPEDANDLISRAPNGAARLPTSKPMTVDHALELLKDPEAAKSLQEAAIAQTTNMIYTCQPHVLAWGVARNTSIRKLDLSARSTRAAMHIGSAGSRALARMLIGNTSLTHLSLHNVNLGLAENGMTMLAAALRYNSTLKYLDLSCNGLTPSDISRLAAALRSPTRPVPHAIEVLDLSENKLGVLGAAAIAELLNGDTTLKHLNLSKTDLDVPSLALITDAVGSSKLETLILDENHFSASKSSTSAKGGPSLIPSRSAGASSSSTVTTLEDSGHAASSSSPSARQHEESTKPDDAIADEGGSDETTSAVLSAVGRPQAASEEPDLSGKRWTKREAQLFQPAATLAQKSHALLKAKQLVGVPVSPNLAQSRSLRHFSASGCSVNDNIVSALVAQLEHIPTLQSLDLAKNRIGSLGAMAIAKFLVNQARTAHAFIQKEHSEAVSLAQASAAASKTIAKIKLKYGLGDAKADSSVANAKPLSLFSVQEGHGDLSQSEPCGPSSDDASKPTSRDPTSLTPDPGTVDSESRDETTEGNTDRDTPLGSYQVTPTTYQQSASSSNCPVDSATACVASTGMNGLVYLNLAMNCIGDEGGEMIARVLALPPEFIHPATEQLGSTGVTAHSALADPRGQPLMSSVMFGATNPEQLKSSQTSPSSKGISKRTAGLALETLIISDNGVGSEFGKALLTALYVNDVLSKVVLSGTRLPSGLVDRITTRLRVSAEAERSSMAVMEPAYRDLQMLWAAEAKGPIIQKETEMALKLLEHVNQRELDTRIEFARCREAQRPLLEELQSQLKSTQQRLEEIRKERAQYGPRRINHSMRDRLSHHTSYHHRSTMRDQGGDRTSEQKELSEVDEKAIRDILEEVTQELNERREMTATARAVLKTIEAFETAHRRIELVRRNRRLAEILMIKRRIDVAGDDLAFATQLEAKIWSVVSSLSKEEAQEEVEEANKVHQLQKQLEAARARTIEKAKLEGTDPEELSAEEIEIHEKLAQVYDRFSSLDESLLSRTDAEACKAIRNEVSIDLGI